MATKLGGMDVDGSLPIKSHDPLNVKSRGKLKSLYFHFHSANGHQTWQTADFP